MLHDPSRESIASEEVKSRDVSHDQHPTPSRSAPAPPNATEALSNDRVSEIICVDPLKIIYLILFLPLSLLL